MSSLIRPFLKDRPISATIRVDRNTIRSPEPESRVFSRVARNSAGDLWTLSYALGLPVVVTLYDSQRKVFMVFQPGESAPSVTPADSDPTEPPELFPREAPLDAPVIVSGLPCFHRKGATESSTSEVWYSYEYAAYARTLIERAGYGATDWYLDEVQLGEPPADIFGELSILMSDSERRQNLWKVASEVFRRMSTDGSSR